MLAFGKTQGEVVEYFEFRDNYVIKMLAKREIQTGKTKAGIVIRPKGRLRKDTEP